MSKQIINGVVVLELTNDYLLYDEINGRQIKKVWKLGGEKNSLKRVLQAVAEYQTTH